ncbi:cilia- and flagella-associated protein 44 [Kryptolebias marmoratus]|uniref:cilia- and flagella-associated protein 44 n=1 Tax=Kryptolebias marmoratus TaxID=37003 RepID=UPI0018ACB99E|nr:cilia- and flagella-associated protein 44 [Kryptolebias marmoratus]
MADEGNGSNSAGEQTASEENTEGSNSGGEPKKELPADMFYDYEELRSRPFITPGSGIPEDFLRLSHSFGYDSRRRANLKLLDEQTLVFIAGNFLVLLDVSTEERRYLRSCSGGGIGAIAVHPSRDYFVVAEKGNKPDVIVYEYPSLKPYRVLRGGAEREFSFLDFNRAGSLLASVAGEPDFLLTLWTWSQEEVTLSCKTVSQEVYRISFSPYDPELMTSSGAGHIRFWKMAATLTGLKLRGAVGLFGKTAATDIDGFVELPDGKVVSGTEWGNLLLWEGNTIEAEICRKEARSCHAGTVQPFALEDGRLMTFGTDGFVRTWDLDRIDSTAIDGDSGRFEMEPVNEMLVGHNVCLSSVVRSSLSDSFVWFAQDSNGAIWKLDLSFTNTAPDPECLFSFHAGPIRGLDVSDESHLMATTALDRSVRVFDFLSNRELITSRFNQGGTSLCWAPSSVNQGGGLLVTGFKDGVVRLLELYNPERLQGVPETGAETGAELRLRQAFKPHNAAVTAVAYEQDGLVLATGSLDSTVFFFAVGDKYNPIGFIQVPGPVQALQWSPRSHAENKLLVFCRNGHVVEVQRPDPDPDPEAEASLKTFQLWDVPSRAFRFHSIKSQIKRDEEVRRRQAEKEKKKKEREEKLKNLKNKAAELLEEEEEEELPPLHVPDPPSPVCCGFYSQPGHFWLSMGGFDAGFLYHCKFSQDQDQDPDRRQDRPFDFRLLADADDDPVRSVTFSSSRQLLLCGMTSGSIRIYPLQPGDVGLSSMQAYWALSVHDNQNGRLRHVRCSHDDLFLLTAADDGNIFSFCLLPPEELQNKLQRQAAKVPSPRVGVESEALALDIEDPAAYSIETAKQKLEKDSVRREAELMVAEKQRQLAELQRKFKQVLTDNQKLPEHVRLRPEELQLHPLFTQLAEELKVQKVEEVRKQLAWERERSQIALRKLQERLKTSMGADIVSVLAIRSDHRVSTYSLPPLPEPLTWIRARSEPDGDAARDRRKSRTEPATDGDQAEEVLVPRPPAARQARIKLGARQEERLRKDAERAEQARAKIETRRQEWAQIYSEKPPDDYVDSQFLQAIRDVKENIGDVVRRKEPRVNAEKKKEELISLQLKIREKQTEMNGRIVALRDAKLQLLSRLAARLQRLQDVQQRLAAHRRLPLPALPAMSPQETPERKLRCSGAVLQRCGAGWARIQVEEGGAVGLLEQLEEEMKAEEQEVGGETQILLASSGAREEEEEELSELEKEVQREEEIRLLHQQDCLLQEMETSVRRFDSELLQLLVQKLLLDQQLKLLDLRLLTIFREMLLLRQFQSREEALQEKLRGCLQKEENITSKLEECNELLELKTRDVTRLQERDKALTATFQASLGDENPFEDFLTKVFRKKIKRVKKKKERPGAEEEEKDSEDDSGEDSDSDTDYDSDGEEDGAALDDSVCPKGCEPELLENTLQLRERRLDLEEQLMEEKMAAEALSRDSETLIKKEKIVKNNRQGVEKDLELMNQEKQQKMNQLDVVVSLQLHQILFVTDGSVPSDLSEALVLDRTELHRLQDCIQNLEAEKVQQKDLLDQDQQRQTRLVHEEKDMLAMIQKLELQCDELMMKKFGRLVDLEALQVLPGNRRLEELKQEKLLLEGAHAKELRLWEVKLEEELQAKMEVLETNSDHLRGVIRLHRQKAGLEAELYGRQRKTGRQQFQDFRRRSDQETIQSLQETAKTQSEQADALIAEIHFLSSKGGQVLPPSSARTSPHVPLPSPLSDK